MELSNSVKYKHLSQFEADILQCISCGDCREAIDLTSNPPKWGVCVAREHSPGFDPYFGRGKMQIIRSLIQGKLDLSKEMAEVIYQCPTCNSCSNTCPYSINSATIYEALRAELVDAGYALDPHISMNNSMKELLNPYQRNNDQKSEWLNKLDFQVKDASTEESDILYFVGCTAAFTPEIQEIAVSTANILHKLNVDFSVFGRNEICCGSVAKRTGNLSVFSEMVSKNYDLFKKTNIKTIITSCAGCYRTLKVDYSEQMEDLGINVYHSIEFIKSVLEKENISLKNLDINVTYHDPCHTGRNSGDKPLYEEPRIILSQIGNLKEMGTIKDNAKCCGAGGGVKKAFPEFALEIAKSRINEAEETTAEYLVSICPFCYRNLSDAIKSLNSNIKMIDLTNLIEKALE